MTTRFVLPGAVAVSLHALVFFGLPRDRHVPAIVDELPPKIVLTALAFDDFQEPPDPMDTSVAMSRGEPDVQRSNEPLASPQSSAFEMPRPEPTTVTANVSNTVIPLGPIGTRDGTGSFSGPTVFSVTNLDALPRTRAEFRPSYPFEAKKDALKGEVLVTFTVDESGRVLNPQVVRSTNTVFEEPTLRAVAKWRFEPGRKNGRAVRFRMALPVLFSVND